MRATALVLGLAPAFAAALAPRPRAALVIPSLRFARNGDRRHDGSGQRREAQSDGGSEFHAHLGEYGEHPRRALLHRLRVAGVGMWAAGGLAPAEARAAPRFALSSKEAERIQQRAKVAESKDEKELAAALWKRIAELEPEYPYAWSNAANAEVAMAKLDEAEMDYTQALELMTEAADSGDRWVMLLNRGATRLALGKDDAGALADLNAAVAARGADAAVVLPSRASAFER